MTAGKVVARPFPGLSPLLSRPQKSPIPPRRNHEDSLQYGFHQDCLAHPVRLLSFFATVEPRVVDSLVKIPLSGMPLTSEPLQDPDAARPCVLRQFLAGPENRMVEAVVRWVFEGPARQYSPLILYGPTGTGKSHLIRGLAAQWRTTFPRDRVVCVAGSEFAHELAEAIDTQDTDQFRVKYRKAGLLVVEDLGELQERLTAQEELVQILDARSATGRWVILTAPTAPAALTELAPRLHSRLTAGLAVPLVAPSAGTRRALLRQLAQLRQIELPETAARLLAEGLNVTVPELFGALVQLETAAGAKRRPIDTEAVRKFLAQRSGARQPELREIADTTARAFSVKLSDIRGLSRRRAIVTARDVAMYLARQFTPGSLQQIGEYFGGRDHSTVIHGCRHVERLIKTDPTLRQAVEQLQRKWQPS